MMTLSGDAQCILYYADLDQLGAKRRIASDMQGSVSEYSCDSMHDAYILIYYIIQTSRRQGKDQGIAEDDREHRCQGYHSSLQISGSTLFNTCQMG